MPADVFLMMQAVLFTPWRGSFEMWDCLKTSAILHPLKSGEAGRTLAGALFPIARWRECISGYDCAVAGIGEGLLLKAAASADFGVIWFPAATALGVFAWPGDELLLERRARSSTPAFASRFFRRAEFPLVPATYPYSHSKPHYNVTHTCC